MTLILVIAAVFFIAMALAVPLGDAKGAKVIGRRDGKNVVQLATGERHLLNDEEWARFQKSGSLPVAGTAAPQPGLTLDDRVTRLERRLQDGGVPDVSVSVPDCLERIAELETRIGTLESQVALLSPPSGVTEVTDSTEPVSNTIVTGLPKVELPEAETPKAETPKVETPPTPPVKTRAEREVELSAMLAQDLRAILGNAPKDANKARLIALILEKEFQA